MNIVQATQLAKKGKKVLRNDWTLSLTTDSNGDLCIAESQDLYYPNTEDILADDWIVVEYTRRN